MDDSDVKAEIQSILTEKGGLDTLPGAEDHNSVAGSSPYPRGAEPAALLIGTRLKPAGTTPYLVTNV
jgi:hypothetical protein